MSQTEKYRQQYLTLLSVFKSNHPAIPVPEPSVFRMWLSRYAAKDIENAIASAPTTLNTEATGKAISSKLRNMALDRAILGGSHE